MTESQWHTSSEPGALLGFVARRWQSAGQPAYADRLLRLLTVAFAREVWEWLTDARSREAVRFAEHLADLPPGTTPRESSGAGSTAATWRQARAAASVAADEAAKVFDNVTFPMLAHDTLEQGDYLWYNVVHLGAELGDEPAVCRILRDLVGDLRRRPVWLRLEPDSAEGGLLVPCWTEEAYRLRTGTVVALAHGCYDERREDGSLDPQRLAVLSDALEEAGCDDANLLEALRRPHTEATPAGHNLYRGFWALDVVLGKRGAS